MCYGKICNVLYERFEKNYDSKKNIRFALEHKSSIHILFPSSAFCDSVVILCLPVIFISSLFSKKSSLLIIMKLDLSDQQVWWPVRDYHILYQHDWLKKIRQIEILNNNQLMFLMSHIANYRYCDGKFQEWQAIFKQHDQWINEILSCTKCFFPYL